MGLLSAVGVSVFYTFSVSSIIPVLKIIFAEHETLVDWLHRVEVEHRLQVNLGADLPDSPEGLDIVSLPVDSAHGEVLSAGCRLRSLDGERYGSYELMERLAETPAESVRLGVISGAGPPQEITLSLSPQDWWWPMARRVAHSMPSGQSPAARFNMLTIVMGAVVVIALLGGICRFLNDGMVATAVQRGLHDLRTRLAAHTLQLPVAWHASQPAGDTLARFANDINKVQVGMSTLLGKVVREPLKAVGVLTLTLLIDWRMLIIGVVGLPIGAVIIRSFGKLVKRAQRQASQSWGRLLDHLGERLAGIRVVKACNMEEAERQRFEAEGQQLTRAQTHIELVDAASNPVLETLASLAISAFILYGGMRVFQHELEPHLFFGAVICLGGIFDPLRKMSNVNNRLQAAEASARRLFELLSQTTEEEEEERSAAIELPPFREQIEFRDVSFYYPINPDREVLREVNLRVNRGQVVALVGPNGSGKTTLMSLLLRFFEPTSGQILIDGQPIRECSLNSLRAQIGLVTQDAVVFSDTVRGNIAYGVGDVPDEELQRAARLAHIDDFVSKLSVQQNGRLLSGYDAPINGRTLSGGQRQRLVLARVILRSPPILILDEATSQVDSESEQRIREALTHVMRDRTTFIIAHRFSTIAHADLIVVLNEGEVVGRGTHDELLSECPFYVTLVETQFAHGG